jgi:hypothetical protein
MDIGTKENIYKTTMPVYPLCMIIKDILKKIAEQFSGTFEIDQDEPYLFLYFY